MKDYEVNYHVLYILSGTLIPSIPIEDAITLEVNSYKRSLSCFFLTQAPSILQQHNPPELINRVFHFLAGLKLYLKNSWVMECV